jgi:large subunit ribosomal protein L3
VTRLRTPEQDGHAALQLGAGVAKRLSKPAAGQFKDLERDLQKPARVREFRVDSTEEYEVGQRVDVSLFEVGELVDVTGVSRGKGFAGTIARHNFKRGPKTHGSNNYRQPGSVGAGTTPGRVFKGTRMGGHMGDQRVTVKKLRVEKIDAERNLLLVRGAVPGARNAVLLVRKAK